MYFHSSELKWLTTYLDNLDIRYGCEPSFKIENNNLLNNRRLITFPKVNLGNHYENTLFTICTKLHAPDDVIKRIMELTHEIDVFHAGFEEERGNQTIKLYLEYASRFNDSQKKEKYNKSPSLVHLAFKWSTKYQQEYTTARYIRYPVTSISDIQNRIALIYDNCKDCAPYNSITQFLLLSAKHINVNQMFYMEVEEDNNPRNSFDLNIYNAKLKILEFETVLYPIINNFQIPEYQYEILFNSIKYKKMGHIAGGTNRNGQEFISIYYGVEVFN